MNVCENTEEYLSLRNYVPRFRTRSRPSGISYRKGRSARVFIISNLTDGSVIIVGEPGQDHCYLLYQAVTMTAPRLIRAWKRRSWIAHHCCLWKRVLATKRGQAHRVDA
jgi:hypothetical protein